MSDFSFMSWDKAALAAAGLPLIDYPVPDGAFEQVVINEGFVQHEALLAWLQQYAETKDTMTWRDYWPALNQIARLLMVPEGGETGVIEAERWRLLLGPVDLAGEVVTVARGDLLVAALAPCQEGAIRAAHYRPLDAGAARCLIGAGQRPLPDGTVCMRSNAFEFLKDQTASAGQTYAYYGGRVYVSYWAHGLGIDGHSEVLGDWFAQQELPTLDWRQLGAELASQALYDEVQPDEWVNVRLLAH